ncbi:MAG: spore coat protein [Christensenellales bacterium]|jgi:hypothetical protein
MFNNSSTQPELESKNLTILEDQMKHEALAVKKSELYAGYFQDPALKSCAQQLAKHHRDNFNGLLSYLESHK